MPQNRLLQATMRYAKEAEDEDQQYPYDECRFSGQILAHDLYERCGWQSR
jgi:hypothetical protein